MHRKIKKPKRYTDIFRQNIKSFLFQSRPTDSFWKHHKAWQTRRFVCVTSQAVHRIKCKMWKAKILQKQTKRFLFLIFCCFVDTFFIFLHTQSINLSSYMSLLSLYIHPKAMSARIISYISNKCVPTAHRRVAL